MAAKRVPLAPKENAELIALIVRAQAGDLPAQSDLIRRYMVRLAGFGRPMVRQTQTVEDLVQTVSIRMVRRLRNLRDPALFEPWLFTMARNAARDHFRRVKCQPSTVSDDLLLVNLPSTHDSDSTRELLEAVERVARAASAVGAFALPSGSRDAALLLTIAPGAYTAQISGVGNTTGVALVEIYDVP